MRADGVHIAREHETASIAGLTAAALLLLPGEMSRAFSLLLQTSGSADTESTRCCPIGMQLKAAKTEVALMTCRPSQIPIQKNVWSPQKRAGGASIPFAVS